MLLARLLHNWRELRANTNNLAKFPFWSAIVTQTQGDVSVAAGASVYVDVQPPSGETWLVFFDAYLEQATTAAYYYDYDGSTRRLHVRCRVDNDDYGLHSPLLTGLCKILTNSRYASLRFYNWSASDRAGCYGYSGFKLSQPLWRPERLGGLQVPPFKRPLNGRKVAFSTLKDKAYINSDGEIAYHLYDEDLARCPLKGDVVERAEHHVLEKDLVAHITTFQNDPDGTGWKRCFQKLAEEGISI